MPLKKYHHGKSKFQEKWISDPELSSWILKVPNDPYSAKCRYCSSVISLSSMGRQALSSHMKGLKHMKASTATSSPSVSSFLHVKPVTMNISKSINPNNNPKDFQGDVAQAGPSTSQAMLPSSNGSAPDVSTDSVKTIVPLGDRGMKKYLLADNVTRSEIIWAIHTVMTHNSFKSAAEGVDTMKLMISDSQIVDKMELHRTKLSYMLLFGIAPFFKNSLTNLVKERPSFVVLFDESFNKISSKQQMDVCIRFWDSEKDETSTRYLTSAFLHSGKAVDLQKSLISSIESLDINNLLQVSMDGPNVNIRLLKDLKVFLSEQGSERKIVDFGSCGLHTAHNAFKCGIIATGWPVVAFLRACYNYFKNSPSRRGDFIRITKSNTFPKKFCAVRWVENVEVAQTALEILPNIKVYMASEEIKKKTEEKSPSFKVLSECIKDPLLGPKIGFFKTLASDAEPFLRELQTDWPYIPFLHSSLSSMVLSVMKRFVNPEKVKIGVDLDSEENLLPVKKIDLGFSTKCDISKLKAKDVNLALLHRDAARGLKAFVKKIETRSPLKFKICKHLSSLDPKLAVKPEGEQLFDKLVEDYVNLNWVSGTKGDNISRQFKHLVKTESFQDSAKDLKRSKTRVDHFWMKEIKKDDPERLLDLKDFLEKTLILSHGNAHVERGFSINKECLVENLQEASLIGLRTVYDGVKAEGGLQNLKITKSLIHYARNSNARYKDHLKQVKGMEAEQKKAKEDMRRKRKLIHELKAKKAKLIEDLSKKSEDIDKEINDLINQV